MIFIKYDKENNNRITFIHYMPFDSVNGLNKTETELKSIGALVEGIPKVPELKDHFTEFYFDSLTNVVSYQYILKPSSILLEEKLQQMVKDGRITQEEMNELL